jgi:hypothetical protein
MSAKTAMIYEVNLTTSVSTLVYESELPKYKGLKAVPRPDVVKRMEAAKRFMALPNTACKEAVWSRNWDEERNHDVWSELRLLAKGDLGGVTYNSPGHRVCGDPITVKADHADWPKGWNAI